MPVALISILQISQVEEMKIRNSALNRPLEKAEVRSFNVYVLKHHIVYHN